MTLSKITIPTSTSAQQQRNAYRRFTVKFLKTFFPSSDIYQTLRRSQKWYMCACGTQWHISPAQQCIRLQSGKHLKILGIGELALKTWDEGGSSLTMLAHKVFWWEHWVCLEGSWTGSLEVWIQTFIGWDTAYVDHAWKLFWGLWLFYHCVH